MAKKSVLIIEDEENIAKAQAMILEDDYKVHIASDGEQGLAKAEELKPHLIILDLMLPKRSGYDVCFNIRQNPALKDTKILMVTAKNQPVDEKKGMFIGADHYLTKPFQPEDLVTAVSKVIER